MQTYHFTFSLSNDSRQLEEWSNAVYSAGGEDSSCGISNGLSFAAFDREAASLEEAIGSAARQVQAAGLTILRCEIDAEELAELFASV
jgi:hypothetical protein